MTSKEIRAAYLEFFKARGHAIIPSAPLIPENDPTTLFTSSGMQPLIPYLLGAPHPLGARLADVQLSFRAEDIEEVGDNRHTTFFEMLGNWSLGDYGRREQLTWFFEFLTDSVGLDPKRLYVSVFIGDQATGVPRDEEAITIWKELFKKKGVDAPIADIGSEANGYEKGMQGARIFAYDAKKNWWSRAGIPAKMPMGEPGGPDSEVFYDFGTPHNLAWGKECHPNCDCGRFIELGNSVFMEYKKGSGGFEKLPKANVDYGGGLERITAAAVGSPDVFATDLFKPTIEALEAASGKHYTEHAHAMRIIADHLRGVVCMAAAGIRPSNTEQGYVMRRLLRRAVRYADKLELREDTLQGFVDETVAPFQGVYEHITSKKQEIKELVRDEEMKFRATLERGMRHFNALSGNEISGQDAFVLFTTYGFPIEITEELARERGMSIDKTAYELAMKEHQDLSRAGAVQKFKGGLADHSEATVRYHTTHHILLKALQMVLGKEVHQRGSNITAERLRIDFSAPRKMTDEEKKRVEDIVNQTIKAHLPVTRSIIPKEEAEALGAEHEFNAVYPDMVTVYSIGPKDATEASPKLHEAFSLEFCGGPHVTNTRVIEQGGQFRIVKEEAVAAGVRRIKAVLE